MRIARTLDAFIKWQATSRSYSFHSGAAHVQASYATTARPRTLPHKDVPAYTRVVSHDQVLGLLEPDTNLITQVSLQ